MQVFQAFLGVAVRLARSPFEFWRNRSGSVAILVAVGMTMILGSVGLGTEGALLLLKRQEMQSAADSAAFSAATAIRQSNTAHTVQEQAQGVAATYGFVDGTSNATVVANNPPLAGSHTVAAVGATAAAGAVEVIVTQPQSALFSKIFGFASITVKARAVATSGSNGGKGCALALGNRYVNNALVDNNLAGAIDVTSNTHVNMINCDLYDDSNNLINSQKKTGALQIESNSSLTAHDVFVAGGTADAYKAGNTSVSPGIDTGTTPDPYANVTFTKPSACTSNCTITSGTYDPGTYSNIDVNGTVTLNPGTYYIDSGNFTVEQASHLTAIGVTIVLTSSGSTYGTMDLKQNNTITLTAPTTGNFEGIAVFQDRAALPSSFSNSNCNPSSGDTGCNLVESNNANVAITGALYFPKQWLQYSANNSTSTCTQLIANWISFSSNNVTLQANCRNSGTVAVGGSGTATALVE